MEQADYDAGTMQLLNESRKEECLYSVNVCGHDYVVFPGVFSPKYFNDTEIFANMLERYAQGVILEIGSGTGVIGIEAALRGHEVIATDINPTAVVNTRLNAQIHGLRNFRVFEGSLYGSLQTLPDRKIFNTIFWNVPFQNTDERNPNLDHLERAVIDPHYRNIHTYLSGSRFHLYEGGWFDRPETGNVLIGFSDTLGNPSLLHRVAELAGYKLEKLESVESTEVHPVTFDLYEAIRI